MNPCPIVVLNSRYATTSAIETSIAGRGFRSLSSWMRSKEGAGYYRWNEQALEKILEPLQRASIVVASAEVRSLQESEDAFTNDPHVGSVARPVMEERWTILGSRMTTWPARILTHHATRLLAVVFGHLSRQSPSIPPPLVSLLHYPPTSQQ